MMRAKPVFCYRHFRTGNSDPLPLGTRTKWGVVKAVGFADGERYYMLVLDGHVAMMPGCVVEEEHAKLGKKGKRL